jgi:predicted metalloprotease
MTRMVGFFEEILFIYSVSMLFFDSDIEEAMNAAAAVGDDTLQEKYQGRVYPDSFTHGTSAQRKSWFAKGYQTGNIEEGDTFNTDI